MKRLLISIVVMAVYFMLTNYLIHEVGMKAHYEATKSIWRADMNAAPYTAYMMLGQLFWVVSFVVIFVKGYQKRGVMEGVRFGLLMSMVCLSTSFMEYAIYPVTQAIFCGWVVGGIVQTTLAGVLLSLVYKK